MADNSLSLYFKLKEQETADLEIISAAAIAWVETLRAVAQAIDPESDVKVELVDVDQSSAIFNTLVDWFERNVDPHLERIARGYDRQPRSRKLLLALALFTITTAYPTYDVYFGDTFTEEDREMLRRIEEQTRHHPAVVTARSKFYRTVEREPAVVGVGIKEKPKDEPIVFLDRKSFPYDDGLFTVEEDTPARVTQTVLEVVLVKPALVHTPRSWTFKPDGLPEFDAVMRDARVLHAIQTKGFPEQMREGIRMTIRIETREVLEDGRWRLMRGGRSVMRVIDPKFD
ncbi:hypothetical protein [Sphingosinicella sp. CPCC 101087]|uniref:hypothetical protein n=1 Tax=Sphingosinicella sp. CPCC 101087 TaxID=2497754 RepID=UPI00101D7D89|nr:hypothetical protein [Sphingosinicella sp. CPCC 101087]